MAYTDDAVLAKLSALNETQESIVTVAQWVMFHRRHADRTGQLWLQRLKDSSANKKLNLIYLANEVAQQSKQRRKDDFLLAFSPVIAEATASAYQGATNEIQQKLKRVVQVWRERNVFELPIQEAIEARVAELDKNRSGNKRGFQEFSGGLSSLPAELKSISSNLQAVSRLRLSTNTSVNGANQDYEKLTDPNVATPSAPVHAARLNGLLKTLANAEGAVTEIMKARSALIKDLEQLLKVQSEEYAKEEAQQKTLSERKTAIDAKKKDVEDAIMRGFATSSPVGSPQVANSPGQSQSPVTPGPDPETDRPEVEALTPPTQSPKSPEPEQRSLTPPAPQNEALLPAMQILQQLQANNGQPGAPAAQVPAVGMDLLASLSAGAGAYGHSNGESSAKKRRLNSGDDFPDLGGDVMDDIDADVAEMLNSK